ncbi:MAG TPA: hypothetical protein VMF10_02900, partial [Candidatus Aquilonibacter sp.]|nr:hypothetical protein [Candidatus Aquilonibacter sp.]
MKNEIKALREEVERLRAEVEEQKVEQQKLEQKGTAPATTAVPAANAAAATNTVPAANAVPSVSAVPAENSAKTAPSAVATAAPTITTAPPPQMTATAEQNPLLPSKTKIAPFSDWDWTWLNGNPRTKEAAFDSKFFTPEIRADATYTYDFNKPVDNTIGGSSEIFRSNEVQLEQLGVGGDFHYDNVRA